MNKLKIKSFGWIHPQLDQVSRINSAFLELGHELIDNGFADFCYVHDSSKYIEGIEYKKKYPKTKLLMKVLDIPFHTNPNYKEWKEKLKWANLILANSVTVKNQIKEFLGYDSYVIYDAIHDLEYKPEIKKTVDFFVNGRVNDPVKRFNLARDLMGLSENKNRLLIISGPDNPNFGKDYIGDYYGIVSDKMLNEIYNSSKFTLMFGKYEGIGLQIPESLVCGTPVVCLSDNKTSYEFCPREFICEPNIENIYNKILEIEKRYYDYQDVAINYGFTYKKFFDKKTVAKRIIDAYLSIV